MPVAVMRIAYGGIVLVEAGTVLAFLPQWVAALMRARFDLAILVGLVLAATSVPLIAVLRRWWRSRVLFPQSYAGKAPFASYLATTLGAVGLVVVTIAWTGPVPTEPRNLADEALLCRVLVGYSFIWLAGCCHELFIRRSSRPQAAALVDDLGEKLFRIDADRIGELAELQHVQLPLAAFDLADKGVRTAESLAEISLRHARFRARGRHCDHHRFVACISELLAHLLPPH